MSIKDKLKAHYAERARHELYIPEADETVYFKTPNLATLKQVTADSKGNPIEMQARLVVSCCTDANGEKIWKPIEYADLMREYDPAVVARIANTITEKANLTEESVKAAEGN